MKPAENVCPECGRGRLAPVVVSKVYEVNGQTIQVDDLMPLECDACHRHVWPNAETQRARRIVELKLRKAAA